MSTSPSEVQPVCIGCDQRPAEIAEYRIAAEEANEHNGEPQCEYCLAMHGEQHMTHCPAYFSPDRYVRAEEGTYNRENGHFLCTECYIRAGQPSSPRGWVAP